ncbi:DHA2 family efflux MFS transporter permease subunit [Cellulomonas wangsupingiae]|uniref:DHA2 family efflux MFS transporter permease subunit n=1 Tax=Cellulomonas wangsupingiae TaxID=2968085 RepID=A0ABY5KDA3_9CELL|nr:DHA2 family efflux MFS transporter permease subunit [Cellulomonas wangsupingiae]MCC2334671.1 DHA2 family efflux MFS transporter permease subunit [Cellulomonas wangsupingiae]MCM0638609.1 DHA2 family efflux MFS transporter permease subunit [Cellulomonas wangsupingiae]UUI66981.1 DHA2 family efflux MFS transporter permease subunit [Cellulomonas wangsupingiae]
MSARDRLAVVLLLVSTFVVILNETIMGVALPRLMDDLAITAGTAQWLTTAFLLTMAVVIPVTGFFLQRTTTRAAFLTSMGLFSLGTLVCALSPGFEVLLVGRVVQATGTAVMLPLLMTTVMTVTPPASRGRTMGNISIVISVAPALGPTISGLILSVLDWRWMFGLVLPVALGALALGAARLPNVTEPRWARVDVPSVLLSAVAFGGLVLGMSRIGEVVQGGVQPVTVGALVGGAAALTLFVARQLALQRTDDALLDLRTFRSRTFAVGVGLMAVMMMSLFGVIILLPIYAQDVLGVDTLRTGLMLLPGGLLMGLLAPLVGRAYDRVGPRPLLVPGTVLVSLSAWGMALLLGVGSPQWLLVAGHVTMSAGLALVFTPLFTSALGSVPPHRYSHGSAVIGTVQQVAGAAGTALFITILSATMAGLAADGASPVVATAGGVRAAFLVGAFLTLPAIVAAFAVRPAPAGAVVPAGH